MARRGQGLPEQAAADPLVPRIRGRAGDLKSLLVEEHRLAGRTASALQPTEVVEGHDLAAPVLDLAAERQSLGQIEPGPLRLAERAICSPQIAQGGGLLPPVVQSREDLPGLRVGLERLVDLAQAAVEDGEVVERLSLSGAVADRPADRQRLPVALLGRLRLA